MKSIRKYSEKIAGRPTTSQRSLLLEVIHQADRHLDADEVYRRAKDKNPRISLATVYRNLKLFKELGLIAESNFGETHSHYEIKGVTEHHHLICLNCGEIFEFDNPLITKVISKTQHDSGFKITSVQLKLEGYCPRCKKKRKQL